MLKQENQMINQFINDFLGVVRQKHSKTSKSSYFMLQKKRSTYLKREEKLFEDVDEIDSIFRYSISDTSLKTAFHIFTFWSKQVIITLKTVFHIFTFWSKQVIIIFIFSYVDARILLNMICFPCGIIGIIYCCPDTFDSYNF